MTDAIKKIAVVGLGAVGGVFAGLLGTLPPSPYRYAALLVGFVLCVAYLLRKKIRSLFG
jgi:ketopantoate reductase